MELAAVSCRGAIKLVERRWKFGSYSSLKQLAVIISTITGTDSDSYCCVIPGWCKRSGPSDAFLKCCYAFVALNDKTEARSVKINRSGLVPAPSHVPTIADPQFWKPKLVVLDRLLVCCSAAPAFIPLPLPSLGRLFPPWMLALCRCCCYTGWLKLQFN